MKQMLIVILIAVASCALVYKGYQWQEEKDLHTVTVYEHATVIGLMDIRYIQWKNGLVCIATETDITCNFKGHNAGLVHGNKLTKGDL